MKFQDVALSPIERGYLHAMRVEKAFTWTVITLILAAGVAVPPLFYAGADWPALWALPVVTALFGLWSVVIAANRQWARWGWAWVDQGAGYELHVVSGWLTRHYRTVPVARVQHINVRQGPIERWFNVATLEVFTAGSSLSRVQLPGITREQAEEMRDIIREKLSVDPW